MGGAADARARRVSARARPCPRPPLPLFSSAHPPNTARAGSRPSTRASSFAPPLASRPKSLLRPASSHRPAISTSPSTAMSWFDAPAPASSSSSSSALGGYRRPSSSSLAAPQAMKRTASMCSLPSPPADYGDNGMDVDEGLPRAPKVPPFGAGAALDSDEVDQLASDEDDEVAPTAHHHGRTKVRASRPCMLGSPAVLFGGGLGAGQASRKQLLNPFLPPAASTSSSSSTSARPPAPTHGVLPLSPSASPVRPPHPSPSRRRHRPDPDRIRLTTPPPRPSAAELEAERARAARDERLRAMGWEDPENPFVERDDAMARRLKDLKPVERPETITYVKCVPLPPARSRLVEFLTDSLSSSCAQARSAHPHLGPLHRRPHLVLAHGRPLHLHRTQAPLPACPAALADHALDAAKAEQVPRGAASRRRPCRRAGGGKEGRRRARAAADAGNAQAQGAPPRRRSGRWRSR